MKPTHYRIPRKAFYFRTMAFNWLRYEQGCHLITFERTPLETEARPDVLGMTRNRQLIEIEIKVDLADLRRDSSKEHRRQAAYDIQRRNPSTPNYVYYMVPEEMVGVALEELPAHYGVISPNHAIKHGHTGMPTIALHRFAVQLHARRLTMREVVSMAKCMSGAMCSLSVELSIVRLKHDSNIVFDPQVVASDQVPKPFSVTDRSAVLDSGNRTGRKVDQHTLDLRWRQAKASPKEPEKLVPDVVQRRKERA